jgi:hypothetical protein
MPKTRRPTTFQHPLFGTVYHNLSDVFKCDSEVCRKEAPRSEYVLRHITEQHTDTLLISLTEEIELYEDIREVYNLYLKIKEETAKDNAMWQEILAIIVEPDFINRSPSPDCDVDPVPNSKRMRIF